MFPKIVAATACVVFSALFLYMIIAETPMGQTLSSVAFLTLVVALVAMYASSED